MPEVSPTYYTNLGADYLDDYTTRRIRPRTLRKTLLPEEWYDLKAIADRSAHPDKQPTQKQYIASHKHPNRHMPDSFRRPQLFRGPQYSMTSGDDGRIIGAVYGSFNTSANVQYKGLGRRLLARTIMEAKMDGLIPNKRYFAIREVGVAHGVGSLVTRPEEGVIVLNAFAVHPMARMLSRLPREQSVTAYQNWGVAEDADTGLFLQGIGMQLDPSSQLAISPNRLEQKPNPTVRYIAQAEHMLNQIGQLAVYGE